MDSICVYLMLMLWEGSNQNHQIGAGSMILPGDKTGSAEILSWIGVVELRLKR